MALICIDRSLENEEITSRNKFMYDHMDSIWIDLNCVISIVTMSYNSTNKVYTLDRNDLEQMSKLVT